MGKTIIMIVFAMTLLLLSNGIMYVKADAGKTSLKVDRKLKLLNKPAVKSIKSEDGDTIDCVDIHKQPAFDHPALRNHIIQMSPTSETSSTKNESSQLVLSQTWTKSGSCPKGTIPIRRIQRQDLLRADSLDHFGRDGPRASPTTYTTNVQRKLLANSPPNHSSVYLYIHGEFSGAKGDINVWSPSVELAEEYTTGQIWLKTYYSDNFGSIEAGWVVYPKLYGNAQPRLFVRWTLDGYKTSGCFNLLCAGFVQTSKNLALGAIIQPVSQRGANIQQLISVRIIYDSGNWWLYFGDEKMGYWPGDLIRDVLTHFFWGGDVYSQNVMKTPHTTTSMGSGDFASGLFANACFVRNIFVYNNSNQWEFPADDLDSYSDEPNCYTAYNDFGKVPPTFYFGGPGRNINCP